MAVLKSLSVKQNLKIKVIDIPEIAEGAQIMLREFTAKAASDFNKYMMESKKDLSTTPQTQGLRFYSALICSTAIDEDGKLISSIEDVDSLLSMWDEKLIFRIGDIAAEINGFTQTKKEEIKKDSPRNQRKQ